MNASPVLEDHSLKLSAPCGTDADARVALGTDPEIAEMFGIGRDNLRPLTKEDAARWVKSLSEHPYAWAIENQGSLIGEIRLDRVDLQDRRASMAIGIYDKASLGRGLGSQAIRLVLEHAFLTMRLHRIGIRVLAYNKRAIRAYEKCGFIVEGCEREAALVNGTWHDDIMMGLLEHEFLSQ